MLAGARRLLARRPLQSAQVRLVRSALGGVGAMQGEARPAAAPRVVSLLPSATEVVCCVGGAALLVGRSHECDFPAEVCAPLPVLTGQLTQFTSAREVDTQVREALASGTSLYTVDEARLRELAPSVIVTQSLCDVCSVEYNQVVKLARSMSPRPRVVSLNPHTLEEVLESVREVGEALGLGADAEVARAALAARAAAVAAAVAAARGGAGRPNVAFLEWPDPVYVGGHWTPQLIALAGGRHALNEQVGAKSFAVPPSALVASDPDCLVLCCCGLDLDKTDKIVRDELEKADWWRGLAAVREGRVAIVDGNQMFNRPGPRLVDCLEWLHAWLAQLGLRPEAAVRPEALRSFPWRPYRLPSAAAPAAGHAAAPPALAPAPAPAPAAAAPPKSKAQLEIDEAHAVATRAGRKSYLDPKTGYSVFTAQAALERGYCCGRGCRHCPYLHHNVPASQRDPARAAEPVSQATLLRWEKRPNVLKKQLAAPGPQRLRVVFWSGGKDSLLALLAARALAQAEPGDSRVMLLTTFDAASQRVPEQDTEVRLVLEQAAALQEDLMLVPLHADRDNGSYAAAVCEALAKVRQHTRAQGLVLVFGDLHLADIKAWRERTFSDYACETPIFGVPYPELQRRLFAAQRELGFDVNVSAASTPAVRVGEAFDAALIDRLAKDYPAVDAFGECGEFHTHVTFTAPARKLSF